MFTGGRDRHARRELLLDARGLLRRIERVPAEANQREAPRHSAMNRARSRASAILAARRA